jgi:dTDP-4-dehydrorhamnose reductase
VKILLTGRNGQVGSELVPLLRPLGTVEATDRQSLDLADPAAIRRVVRDAKPDVIINTAAYTAVDKAESEEALALRINGEAPGVMADEAKRLGALLVHYSTDYVFDGEQGRPYVEDDPVAPLGAYGRTKLEGEQRIRAAGARHAIVRTAWVYGNRGNFVRAILRQAGKGAALRVVNDQFGAPTWARDIAAITTQLVRKGAQGTYHVSAAGQASWYEVAQEVLRVARLQVDVLPVTTAEYGARAPRPRYSVLDNRKLRTAGFAAIADWRERLPHYLDALKSAA